jgi:glutaredoxin
LLWRRLIQQADLEFGKISINALLRTYSAAIEESMKKELVVYGRTWPCPDLTRAKRFLEANNISYRQINIDQDDAAAAFVEQWVGHRSVPTIIVAPAGEVHPIAEPAPIPPGRSVRSFDRGTMITEPSEDALHGFLQRHELWG